MSAFQKLCFSETLQALVNAPSAGSTYIGSNLPTFPAGAKLYLGRKRAYLFNTSSCNLKQTLS